MLRKADYPILEFDDDRNALIEPAPRDGQTSLAERCVLCFLQDVIDLFRSRYSMEQVSTIQCVMGPLPVYQFEYKGTPLVIAQPGLGAPFAAGFLEEVISRGCHKFIITGTCGVLQNEILPGNVIVPTAAVRDEGTSYHYLPPSREVTAQAEVNQVIESVLLDAGIAFRSGKVWTTDAFYRETRERVKARREEGCIAVDMEAAAMYAVAAFRRVELGGVLIGADDVSGDIWDERAGRTPLEFRTSVVEACLDAVIRI